MISLILLAFAFGAAVAVSVVNKGLISSTHNQCNVYCSSPLNTPIQDMMIAFDEAFMWDWWVFGHFPTDDGSTD